MPAPKQIDTLSQFYQALEVLYRDIESSCRECQDPDCVGYVWLLAAETEELYNLGVPVVQVNNGPSFIHSFSENSQGELGVGEPYPRCSQVCAHERRCSIHDSRPLVCRLYPIGFETKTDGTVIWALHQDCLHVRKLTENGALADFKERAIKLINSLAPGLLAEIVRTYRAVYAISVFPNGENSCMDLKEVQKEERR